MLSLPSTKSKSLASNVSFNAAKGAKDKRVVHSESSLRAETTNANRIANSLMERLGQCNGMFAKLLEVTNNHVYKYTGLFPEYHKINQWEKGNKISK